MTSLNDTFAGRCSLEQPNMAFAAKDFQTTLVGIMGHDLRQHLQIILSTYGLLRCRLENLPQQAWIDRGERAARKLTEQLNYLIGAFYLAERSETMEVSPVRLGPLFWHLQQENEYAAIQRGIQIRAVGTDAYIMSNTLLLGCVLRNIVSNAMKYTEPGGRILIGCRRKGQDVRIDVYDTGIGIPEEDLPRIFKAFTRLAPEGIDGLGVGLSIVRRALELLGHRIEVRSVVNEGSLFSIYVPVANCRPQESTLRADLDRFGKSAGT